MSDDAYLEIRFAPDPHRVFLPPTHSLTAYLLTGFCDDFGMFDADRTSNGDRRKNFRMRMDHIRDHIM